MKAPQLTGEEAILECLAIIDRCAGATAPGRYADGYRAAALDIRTFIESRFGARPIAAWQRDVREMEIEARTISRVIGLVRREQASASSAAVRRVLENLIDAIDEGDVESSVRISLDVG